HLPARPGAHPDGPVHVRAPDDLRHRPRGGGRVQLRGRAPPMSDRAGRSFAALRTSILLPIALGIVLFLVGSVLIDGFASIRSVRAVLVLAAFVGLASVGQT